MNLTEHYKFLLVEMIINEQEELQERKLAALAAGAATILGGLQAGSMMHNELPTRQHVATSVEKVGNETQTINLTRAEFAKKGEQANFAHKGFFDLKPKIVVDDDTTGKPTESKLSKTLEKPDGTETATRIKTGDKVTHSGSFAKTDFSNPIKDSEGNLVSSPTVSSRTDMFTSDNMPTTSAGSPLVGMAGTLLGAGLLGGALRRRK